MFWSSALAIGALASVVGNASVAGNCLTAGQQARMKAPPRSAQVSLVWATAPARVAAALLRAVLLSAGYEAGNVTLVEDPRARTICTAFDALHSGSTGWNVSLVVSTAERRSCEWPRFLEVLQSGVAPVSPRPHARLLHPTPACRAVAAALPYSSPAPHHLHDCGFPQDLREIKLIVFLLEDEWDEDETEFETTESGERASASAMRKLLARNMTLHFQNVSRAELAKQVATATYSFLFYDAELWRDVHSVLPLPSPSPPTALLPLHRDAVEHVPAVFTLLSKNFFNPDLHDLRALLAVPSSQLEDEACARVHLARDYIHWQNVTMNSSKRMVKLVVCSEAEKNDTDAYVDDVYEYVDATTRLPFFKAKLNIEALHVECDNPAALSVELAKWGEHGLTWRTVGVAAPAELAASALGQATLHAIPLLAYTPVEATPPLRSTAGSAAQLAAALRRVLAACGWRRVGLLSDDTPEARALAAALQGAGLAVNKRSAGEPELSVMALHELDTRVFVVNAGAARARAVLEAAAQSPALDAARHVWIVREYDAADAATAALRPLGVSFEWRGAESPPSQAWLRRVEDKRWTGRAWPLHAAAQLDAVLALTVGYDRLVTSYPEVLDHHQMQDKLMLFWKAVENKTIPGVLEDLNFKQSGIFRSMYVVRWGNESRPCVLGTYSDTQDVACPAPGVDDGLPRCVVRPADPYSTQCYDLAVFGGGSLLLLLLLLAALGAAAARRWLARRDRRLRCATAAHILAQREAAFVSLSRRLVPRELISLDDEELGAGRFGRVQRGEVRRSGRRPVAVAVKKLRAGASPAEESQFLHEARLLAELDHEHVVRFEGVCWEGGPPLLLMELAVFGDLLHYLRARRHLAGGDDPEAAAVSAEALTRLAREAAEALAYLDARGLVHRDVRAANCLVNARRSLLLADFGLARETGATDGEYACRGRALFPVLWMAPESLARGVATAASDAWSFGVLALELVTLGARPFGGAAPEAAVRAVLAGGRPPLPRDAGAELRALALACWRREPSARPAAARLASWLARRATALRPALASDLDEPDCDSGIGEPDAPLLDPPAGPRPAE